MWSYKQYLSLNMISPAIIFTDSITSVSAAPKATRERLFLMLCSIKTNYRHGHKIWMLWVVWQKTIIRIESRLTAKMMLDSELFCPVEDFPKHLMLELHHREVHRCHIANYTRPSCMRTRRVLLFYLNARV